jgi:hypothetical protein
MAFSTPIRGGNLCKKNTICILPILIYSHVLELVTGKGYVNKSPFAECPSGTFLSVRC